MAGWPKELGRRTDPSAHRPPGRAPGPGPGGEQMHEPIVLQGAPAGNTPAAPRVRRAVAPPRSMRPPEPAPHDASRQQAPSACCLRSIGTALVLHLRCRFQSRRQPARRPPPASRPGRSACGRPANRPYHRITGCSVTAPSAWPGTRRPSRSASVQGHPSSRWDPSRRVSPPRLGPPRL